MFINISKIHIIIINTCILNTYIMVLGMAPKLMFLLLFEVLSYDLVYSPYVMTSVSEVLSSELQVVTM